MIPRHFLGLTQPRGIHWQAHMMQLDQFLLSHAGLGSVGTSITRIEWSEGIFWGREVYGPRQMLVMGEISWETWVLSPEGTIGAELFQAKLDWSPNIDLSFMSYGRQQFTKLLK